MVLESEGLSAGTSGHPSIRLSFALTRKGDAWRSVSRIGDSKSVTSGAAISQLRGSPGRYHPSLDVALGSTFLTIKVGKHVHLIRWDGGRLE